MWVVSGVTLMLLKNKLSYTSHSIQKFCNLEFGASVITTHMASQEM
jgi:hypothetical protein